MAEGSKENRERIIVIEATAEDDLHAIFEYTFRTWGHAQALLFDLELNQFFKSLADDPDSGTTLDKYPNIKVSTFKSTNDRFAHGYRVFYTFTDISINVLTLIHTARNH